MDLSQKTVAKDVFSSLQNVVPVSILKYTSLFSPIVSGNRALRKGAGSTMDFRLIYSMFLWTVWLLRSKKIRVMFENFLFRRLGGRSMEATRKNVCFGYIEE